MKVVALCQVYNEELLLERALKWIEPLVDLIIVTEGKLTPTEMAQNSTDQTREILTNANSNKIHWLKGDLEKERNNLLEGRREGMEGINKRFMLSYALQNGLENGDLLYIFDVDEFYHKDDFNHVLDLFRKYDSINHVPLEWFNFVYNLKQGVRGSIDGRFLRYRSGSTFGSTNHFVYEGQDITKDYKYLRTLEKCRLYHLSYAKHPINIKEKVLSFNRDSFTQWYNHCYLIGAIDPNLAYSNNRILSSTRGWSGEGFLEGQNHKIEELPVFMKELPDGIKDLDVDWVNYICQNHDKLRVAI